VQLSFIGGVGVGPGDGPGDGPGYGGSQYLKIFCTV